MNYYWLITSNYRNGGKGVVSVSGDVPFSEITEEVQDSLRRGAIGIGVEKVSWEESH